MRALVVCFAYACAAFAAVAAIISLTFISEGETLVIRNATDFRILLLMTMVEFAYALVYALPVALPVIIASEIRHSGDWKAFACAGAVLGVLLAFLLAELPFHWSNLWFTAPLVPIAVLAALVYWTVAWKWMPPKVRGSATYGSRPK